MSRESLLEERMDAQREERVFAPVPEPHVYYEQSHATQKLANHTVSLQALLWKLPYQHLHKTLWDLPI
jgi:hypothetical protein